MVDRAKTSNYIKESGKLFLLSAPSGAGKTTIVSGVIKELSGQIAIERVVTYTSRRPRPGEVQGLDYFFVSPEEFEEKIKQGFFMEWSNAYGAYYGSPVEVLERLKEGVSLIAVLDQDGVGALLKQYSAVAIWIDPPELCYLKERLEHRGSERGFEQSFRLELAGKELSNQAKLALFKYRVLNQVLAKAIEEVKDIILKELGKN